MSTPAQPGKREWKAAIAAARTANAAIRTALRRAMAASQNANVRALLGRMALELAENEAALNRLEEIGRNASKRKE